MNTKIDYKHYASIRDSLGLKDSQVADASGISRSSFSDWKHGKSTPKIDKIQKITSYLGIPFSELAGIEETQELPSYKDELLDMILKLSPEQRKLVTQLVKSLLQIS